MRIFQKKFTNALFNGFLSLIRTKKSAGIITLFLVVLLMHAVQVFCQPVYREEVVQSAILYSITKFVEWPAESFPSDRSPLKVCIFGEDLLQKELMKWQERSYFGRPIKVGVFNNLAELQKALHECQVLYIADNQWHQSKKILSLTKSLPILSASDEDTFFENEGIVSFVEIGGRVNFCLNLDIAAQNRLRISSKLFGLSLSIIKNGTIMEQR